MTASTQNEDMAIASTPKDQNMTPHTNTRPDPVLEQNQDVLASSQRRRYLDSLDASDLTT